MHGQARTRKPSETLEHYKLQLIAAQFREAALKRRIDNVNVLLRPLGVQIGYEPYGPALVFVPLPDEGDNSA
jgi:hypothetical protein